MPAKKTTKATSKKTRSTGSTRKRKSSAKRPSFLKQFFTKLMPSRRFWWSTLFFLVLSFSAWILVIDFQVREKFEGKKWAIPARVYARPLEIYEGLLLKPDALKQELLGLGYKPVKKVSGVGQFAISGSISGFTAGNSKRNSQRYDIYTRGFVFPEGEVKASRYQVSFSLGEQGYRVSQLQWFNPEADQFLLRLEPKEIGSIYPRHGEDRILEKLDNIPPLLGQTLIAVEDKEFAYHHGISFKGIARAMLANIKAGRFVQGGSTLTQQLVKNFYLTQDKTLGRKIKEAIMAPLLELHYSKAEILEAYINEVYLGQSSPRAIHGFGLAAKHYFNHSLKDLSVHQIALLVSTVKGASYFNPWRHPERAKKRRNTVLQLMKNDQLITPAEHKTYSEKPLDIVKKQALSLVEYPAFLDLVKRQLRRDYRDEDLQSEGLKIFTTMSPTIQSQTENAIKKRLAAMNKKDKKLQAAAIITAVGSGEILSLVGDRNPRYSGFNRALDMQRSIGSLAKPFVYLAALSSKQYTLATIIEDSAVKYPLPNGTYWEPKNFTGQSHGNVLFYQALVSSYNQSTAKLGLEVGVSQVAKLLQSSGLNRDIEPLPSLLLGALDLSPLEVSHLYHTLAADGVFTPLRAIRNVLDVESVPLQRYSLNSEPRIDTELSYLMHYNLEAVMRKGTGKRVYQQLPSTLNVAGKTGTSNRQRDSWFAGYSADHLGVVWVGYDDNKPTSFTGSSAALPIWSEIFKHISTRGVTNNQPETIEYYWVDSVNGLRSLKECNNAILVPFIAGTQPTEKTDCDYVYSPINRWLGN